METQGALDHPMTQDKIEPYHRSMKNVVTFWNYYSQSVLEQAIGECVEHYRTQRYHEAIDNPTCADLYSGTSERALSRENGLAIGKETQSCVPDRGCALRVQYEA